MYTIKVFNKDYWFLDRIDKFINLKVENYLNKESKSSFSVPNISRYSRATFKKKNIGVSKSEIVKKHEIIDNYKKELFEILEASENDKNLQMQERIKFLKKVNYELSMNIFFDENEAKQILKELSELGK